MENKTIGESFQKADDNYVRKHVTSVLPAFMQMFTDNDNWMNRMDSMVAESDRNNKLAGQRKKSIQNSSTSCI